MTLHSLCSICSSPPLPAHVLTPGNNHTHIQLRGTLISMKMAAHFARRYLLVTIKCVRTMIAADGPPCIMPNCASCDIICMVGDVVGKADFIIPPPERQCNGRNSSSALAIIIPHNIEANVYLACCSSSSSAEQLDWLVDWHCQPSPGSSWALSHHHPTMARLLDERERGERVQLHAQTSSECSCLLALSLRCFFYLSLCFSLDELLTLCVHYILQLTLRLGLIESRTAMSLSLTLTTYRNPNDFSTDSFTLHISIHNTSTRIQTCVLPRMPLRV